MCEDLINLDFGQYHPQKNSRYESQINHFYPCPQSSLKLVLLGDSLSI